MKHVSRSTLLAAGSALLVVVLAAGVAAQGRPGGPMGPGGRMGPGGPMGLGGPGGPGQGRGPMASGLPLGQLGLSEDQQSRVQEIMARHRGDLQPLGERLRVAAEAQRKAIETVPVNEGLVRSTSDVVAAAQADMAVLQATIHSDVFAVLTPEQQKKAARIAAERDAKMKQFQQGRKGRLEHWRQRRAPQGQQQ